MTKPITPNEVVKLKKEIIVPDAVIEAFNECIAKNWSGGAATVKQPEVISKIIEKLRTPDDENASANIRSQIFNNHWLDVEDIYRQAGWRVEYDKPGYNETYDAYFVFRKK